MTMNLLVPIGEIKFCLHDQRLDLKPMEIIVVLN